MPLKFEPSVERSIYREIDYILEKELGLTKDSFQFNQLKNEIIKDFQNLFADMPGLKQSLALDSQALSLFAHKFMEAHHKQPQNRPLLDSQRYPEMKLIHDCIELINKLAKDDKELAEKLKEIFQKNMGKVYGDKNEAMNAFKIILTLHVLLKENDKTKLNQFVKGLTPRPMPGAKKEEDEISDARKTNIKLYGIDPQAGTHHTTIASSDVSSDAPIQAMVASIKATPLGARVEAPGQPIGDGYDEVQKNKRRPAPSPFKDPKTPF